MRNGQFFQTTKDGIKTGTGVFVIFELLNFVSRLIFLLFKLITMFFVAVFSKITTGSFSKKREDDIDEEMAIKMFESLPPDVQLELKLIARDISKGRKQIV